MLNSFCLGGKALSLISLGKGTGSIHQLLVLIKGTLSRVDMRERSIQNLKKSAWCFQVEHSHFQYGVN